MGVQMVRIGHMRMGMLHRRVAVPMTVRASRHRLVRVQVMPVIMPMGVFMRDGLVGVAVFVRFGQVQQHAHCHQRAAPRHDPGG